MALTKCSDCPLQGHPQVCAKPTRGALAIVGEAPGTTEVDLGEYFVGATGQRVKAAARKESMAWDGIHKNNAVRCQAPANLSAADWKLAIEACSARLTQELQASGARVILALGRRAFNALTNIYSHATPYWGATMPAREPLAATVLPSIHPAACLRGQPYLWPVFAIHFSHAAALTKGAPQWTWQPLHYYGTDAKATLAALEQIAHAPEGTLIGFDTETAGIDALTAPLTALGLATAQASVSILWPPERHFTDPKQAAKALKLCRQILANPRLHKVAHNGAYDLTVLPSQGFKVRGYTHDTLLLHAIAANLLPHNLGFASQLEFATDPWKPSFKVTKDDKGRSGWASVAIKRPDALTLYNAKDAAILPYLVTRLLQRIERDIPNGAKLYQSRLALSLIAADLSDQGACVDRKAARVHSKRLKWHATRARNLLDVLVAEAYKREGKQPPESFNPNAAAHVKALFFDVLNLPATNWSVKTGAPSLPKNRLQQLTAHGDPIVKQIATQLLSYRKHTKLYSTYVKGWLALPPDDSTIHATAKVHGTKGGRWSYTRPNLQNIVSGLRDVFVPRHPDSQWILEADFSQLELRIIAYLSGDKLMCDWFQQGLDMHMETARIFFGPVFARADKDGQKKLRKLAKAINFGDNYGASAETLWRNIQPAFPGIALVEVERLQTLRHAAHPGMIAWRRATVERAHKLDYTECPISQRRQYFYKVVEPNKAINYPIQGTGSDIIDPAIERIYAAFKRTGHSRLLFQVHDALVCETSDPVACATILKRHMEAPVILNNQERSFPVDFKVGRSWGASVECHSIDDIKRAIEPKIQEV